MSWTACCFRPAADGDPVGGRSVRDAGAAQRAADPRGGAVQSQARQREYRVHANAAFEGASGGRIAQLVHVAGDPASGAAAFQHDVQAGHDDQGSQGLTGPTGLAGSLLTPSTVAQAVALAADGHLPAVLLRFEPARTGTGKAHVVPVWCNSHMQQTYGLGSAKEYQQVLRRFATRDPLITHQLEKAVKAASGRATASSKASDIVLQHTTADPSSGVPGMLCLRLVACRWRDGAQDMQPSPAVLVQHGVPLDSNAVAPRVLRENMALNLLPHPMTIATFQGQVLFQNAASLAYWGDMSTDTDIARDSQPLELPLSGPTPPVSGRSRTTAASALSRELAQIIPQDAAGQQPQPASMSAPMRSHTNPDDKNLLKQLFLIDHTLMEEALQSLSVRNMWSGVVQVPCCMKQHLRSQRRQRAAVQALARGTRMLSASDLGSSEHGAHSTSEGLAGPVGSGSRTASGFEPGAGSLSLTTPAVTLSSWRSSSSPLASGTAATMAAGSTLDMSAPSSQAASDLGPLPGPSQGWSSMHSALHMSADSYESGDYPPGNVPSGIGPMSIRQAALEPVQEAELEVELDLMDEDEPPRPTVSRDAGASGSDPALGRVSDSTPARYGTPFAARRSPSAVQLPGRQTDSPGPPGAGTPGLPPLPPLPPRMSDTGTTSVGPDSSRNPTLQQARTLAGGSMERDGNTSVASAVTLSSSFAMRELLGSSEGHSRSFTLSKSVTAVLETIERKRSHVSDVHSSATGALSPVGPTGRMSMLSGAGTNSTIIPALHDLHGADGSVGPEGPLSDARASSSMYRMSRMTSAFRNSSLDRTSSDQLAGWDGRQSISSANRLAPHILTLGSCSVGSPGYGGLMWGEEGLASPPLSMRPSHAPVVPSGADTGLNSAGPRSRLVVPDPPAQPHSHALAGGPLPAVAEVPTPTPDSVPTAAGAHRNAEPRVWGEGAACWHEVTAVAMQDPVLDQRVLLIAQADVTHRVHVERQLADLTTAQMTMLEQMFPRHIIENMLCEPLSQDAGRVAHAHERVCVLFADVVGFTEMSKEIPPSQVMHFLNTLYASFDALLEQYGLYQLDTMGDCYIVAGGLVHRDQDGFHSLIPGRTPQEAAHDAHSLMEFAKAMLRQASQVRMLHNDQPVQLRIGIHSGRLVSGLLGTRLPKFTLFGDTMNVASRLESLSHAGCIHVSDALYRQLLYHRMLIATGASDGSPGGLAPPLPGSPSRHPPLTDHGGTWEHTGGVEVKGKGRMVTYLFRSRPQPPSPPRVPVPSGQPALPFLVNPSSASSMGGTAHTPRLGSSGGSSPLDIPGAGGPPGAEPERPSLPSRSPSHPLSGGQVVQEPQQLVLPSPIAAPQPHHAGPSQGAFSHAAATLAQALSGGIEDRWDTLPPPPRMVPRRARTGSSSAALGLQEYVMGSHASGGSAGAATIAHAGAGGGEGSAGARRLSAGIAVDRMARAVSTAIPVSVEVRADPFEAARAYASAPNTRTEGHPLQTAALTTLPRAHDPPPGSMLDTTGHARATHAGGFALTLEQQQSLGVSRSLQRMYEGFWSITGRPGAPEYTHVATTGAASAGGASGGTHSDGSPSAEPTSAPALHRTGFSAHNGSGAGGSGPSVGVPSGSTGGQSGAGGAPPLPSGTASSWGSSIRVAESELVSPVTPKRLPMASSSRQNSDGMAADRMGSASSRANRRTGSGNSRASAPGGMSVPRTDSAGSARSAPAAVTTVGAPALPWNPPQLPLLAGGARGGLQWAAPDHSMSPAGSAEVPHTALMQLRRMESGGTPAGSPTHDVFDAGEAEGSVHGGVSPATASTVLRYPYTLPPTSVDSMGPGAPGAGPRRAFSGLVGTSLPAAGGHSLRTLLRSPERVRVPPSQGQAPVWLQALDTWGAALTQANVSAVAGGGPAEGADASRERVRSPGTSAHPLPHV